VTYNQTSFSVTICWYYKLLVCSAWNLRVRVKGSPIHVDIIVEWAHSTNEEQKKDGLYKKCAWKRRKLEAARSGEFVDVCKHVTTRLLPLLSLMFLEFPYLRYSFSTIELAYIIERVVFYGKTQFLFIFFAKHCHFWRQTWCVTVSPCRGLARFIDLSGDDKFPPSTRLSRHQTVGITAYDSFTVIQWVVCACDLFVIVAGR